MARITPSRSSGRSAAVTTFLAPVTVMITSASATATSRAGVLNPSRCALSLVTGSVSTTDTRAYAPRKLAATPRPHAPYPNTVTCSPLVVRFVDRR